MFQQHFQIFDNMVGLEKTYKGLRFTGSISLWNESNDAWKNESETMNKSKFPANRTKFIFCDTIILNSSLPHRSSLNVRKLPHRQKDLIFIYNYVDMQLFCD